MATGKPLPGTKGHISEVTDEMRTAGSAKNTPVFMQVEIGRFNDCERTALRDAFEVIAHQWDESPYEGAPLKGSYTFQLDEHRFTVSVEPLPSGRGRS